MCRMQRAEFSKAEMDWNLLPERTRVPEALGAGEQGVRVSA